MTTEEAPADAFQRLDIFVSNTGKKHLPADRPWGPGPACINRFVFGRKVSGLKGDLDCGHCVKQSEPDQDA